MQSKRVVATMVQVSRKLLAQADEVCVVDPEMCEAAAMVYIGDTYSLRDDMITADDQHKQASGFSTCLED